MQLLCAVIGASTARWIDAFQSARLVAAASLPTLLVSSCAGNPSVDMLSQMLHGPIRPCSYNGHEPWEFPEYKAMEAHVVSHLSDH